MDKKLFQFLEEMENKEPVAIKETASEWIRGLPNYFKNVISKIADPRERVLKIAETIKKAKESTTDPLERKETISLIEKLRSELPQLQKNITEGEDNMADKKTNLDMFLEGVESVEVSKKPKFHSIQRLYEATDKDYEDEMDENKEKCDDEEGEEMDEVIVNEAKKKKDDEEEGAEHEAAETDDAEKAEKEAGDDDEAGGEDEEPEADEDKEKEEVDENQEGGEEEEGEEMDEAAFEDVLKALGSDPISGTADLINMLISKVNQVVAGAKDKADAQAKVKAELEKMRQASEARRGARGAAAKGSAAAMNVPGASKMEDSEEMGEGAQGYAAGLKGVQDAHGKALPHDAKSAKSGKNLSGGKVAPVKMNITGDKKLLKKPTTLKGDSYPKSSVAGAARPGAPKSKKS